jgi:hypothetical protein
VRKVDHSRASYAEVKNEWSCTTPPPHTVVAWTGMTLFLHLLNSPVASHYQV